MSIFTEMSRALFFKVAWFYFKQGHRMKRAGDEAQG